MSDALICDRCGETANPRFNRWNKRKWTMKYKSVHKPSTFIGARNRSFDLCPECRRKLDAFLGLGRGNDPSDPEGYDD